MIVVTLSKVSNLLRGDLTKWYQEIQTGVYVGNVSARVRDLLWDRVLKNIGSGEATMVYNAKNELGYQFKTTRRDYEVADFDGIPLMRHLTTAPQTRKLGFSNAAKFHRAKVMTQKSAAKHRTLPLPTMVSLDIETTGLEVEHDEIISIGAVKRLASGEKQSFYRLIKIAQKLPAKIVELTGITSDRLDQQGIDLKIALQELRMFVKDLPIIGYNVRFDEAFLDMGYEKVGQSKLSNSIKDLMPVVKKTNEFLDNYRLEAVLSEYRINNSRPHNALADAEATLTLGIHLIKNGDFEI